MNFMDLFRRKKSKKKSTPDEAPTAIDYVDWLFHHMLSTSQTTLTIDTRRALPGSGPLSGDALPPPCLPETAVVINRLKILAGINPVKQSEPVKGSFDRPRKHLTIITNCRFLDADEYSTCAINIVVKALNV